MPHCGGPLHRANYQRKPRGGPPDLDEAYSVRLSLCCGRAGCRRRVLPPSVLFWGRRVYWGAVVLVVTALRQERAHGATVKRLKELFGVTRPTLARWRSYFLDLFVQSPCWRRLSGRLMPPVDHHRLPGSLIDRFLKARGDPESALSACLQALALGP
jgi:hypothetical protein